MELLVPLFFYYTIMNEFLFENINFASFDDARSFMRHYFNHIDNWLVIKVLDNIIIYNPHTDFGYIDVNRDDFYYDYFISSWLNKEFTIYINGIWLKKYNDCFN